jgi:hypothetical protein
MEDRDDEECTEQHGGERRRAVVFLRTVEDSHPV